MSYPLWEPQDFGYLAWTYDPFEQIRVEGRDETVNPPPGRVTFSELKIAERITVTGITVGVVTGSGLTPGENFVGIYDADNRLLASSADQTKKFEGHEGDIVTPIPIGPVTIPHKDELIKVAILCNGNTPGCYAHGNHFRLAGAPYTTVGLRSGVANRERTTLPTMLAEIEPPEPNAGAIWFGLS